MTKHLGPQEFIDLIEGVLSLDRIDHLEECSRCREEGASLRGLMQDAREVTVPDPSPLFWNHLSQRIKNEVLENKAASPWWRIEGFRSIATATSIALVLLTVVGTLVFRSSFNQRPFSGTGNSTEVGLNGLVETAVDSAFNETSFGFESDWELVLAIAKQTEWRGSAADAFFVERGVLDEALSQLSLIESRRLKELIEADLSENAS